MKAMIEVKPTDINWHPDLPIFAKETFLKAVSDEYGCLGGFSESGQLRCILPFTIVHKFIFRMVRFRVETIPMVGDFDAAEEKSFLNGTIAYFRSTGVDMIIPATTNTIFRAYPDGAAAAPYGTYRINLSQPEETLFNNIDRNGRRNIKSARESGVAVREAVESELGKGYRLIRETFQRSGIRFMSYDSFRLYLSGLGEYALTLVADYQHELQSFVVFAFSNYCAYAIYAGNSVDQQRGANKLIYWEAIRRFRNQGIRWYDFVGARINPEKGTKQEALALFKERFGATLKKGYMWKYSFNSLKYRLYNLAVRLRSGGDIVDAERHKLRNFNPTQT
jgi:hypothetical protein